jgi:hypothetical protein
MSVQLAKDSLSKQPVNFDPAQLDFHTAVIAQSGSGKSFMLMRLIEELALKTKARIIVLDSNSDFIRMQTPNPEVWAQRGLSDWFPSSDTLPRFKSNWKKVRQRGIAILTNRNLTGATEIVFDCGGLNLAEMLSLLDIDPRESPELSTCVEVAREIARQRWPHPEEPFDYQHFQAVAQQVAALIKKGVGRNKDEFSSTLDSLHAGFGAELAIRFLERVKRAEAFEIWRSRGDGLADVRRVLSGPAQLVVVDLLSLNSDHERDVVASAILTELWEQGKLRYWEAIRDYPRSDRRVVTFIVVDEAHNLAPLGGPPRGPADPASQVVRIATEGRKFGLRLIVASQRPRRLDSNVLSQCDNLILMRSSNASDVRHVCESFGLEEHRNVPEARSLSSGDMILAGPLSVGHRTLHCIPPRTVPGARAIRRRNWTAPYQ